MIKFLKKWLGKSKIHILVWIIFICYETLIVGMISGVFGDSYTYLLYYTVNISLFYFHAKIGLPWAMRTGNFAIFKIPAMVVFESLVYLLLIFLVNLLLQNSPWSRNTFLNFHQQFSLKGLFRCFYFMGFSTGYYFLETYLKEKQRNEELERREFNSILQQRIAEKQLSQARNDFLKAQINPHFLFNTLDFIYQKIDLLDPEASQAIIKLAQMMRFALDTDEQGEFVDLSEEIMQVENLIELNRVRKPTGVNFIFSYTEEALNSRLIPLVLLTLGENIFKHGNLSSPDHPARMQLYVDQGQLYIEAENLKNRHTKIESNKSGLDNIRSRLKYSYGDGVRFSHYVDKSDYFRLKLVLPLV